MSDRKVYSALKHPPKVLLRCKDASLTRQEEAKACDVNVIIRKYYKTGVIPVDQREAFFADVTTSVDYREALTRVKAAESFFYQLPPETRAEFANDPAEFLDVVSDPDSRERLVELGLLEAEGQVPGDAEPEPPPEPAPEPPDGA